jgi:hypothetical protein
MVGESEYDIVKNPSRCWSYGEIESDTDDGAEMSVMSKTGLRVFDGDLMAEF